MPDLSENLGTVPLGVKMNALNGDNRVSNTDEAK